MIWFAFLTMAMQTNQEGMVKFNLNDWYDLVAKQFWFYEQLRKANLFGYILAIKKMFVLLYQETFNDLYFSYMCSLL